MTLYNEVVKYETDRGREFQIQRYTFTSSPDFRYVAITHYKLNFTMEDPKKIWGTLCVICATTKYETKFFYKI